MYEKPTATQQPRSTAEEGKWLQPGGTRPPGCSGLRMKWRKEPFSACRDDNQPPSAFRSWHLCGATYLASPTLCFVFFKECCLTSPPLIWASCWQLGHIDRLCGGVIAPVAPPHPSHKRQDNNSKTKQPSQSGVRSLWKTFCSCKASANTEHFSRPDTIAPSSAQEISGGADASHWSGDANIYRC